MTALCLLALLVFWSERADAQNRNICPDPGGHVQIFFNSTPGEVRYSRAYDSAGLARLRQSRGGSALGSNWFTTGLTETSEFRKDLTYEFSIYQLAPNRFCVVLKKAQLDIGYEFINVYISNKYAPGTCEYRSVLNHEDRHVAIFQNALLDYSQLIQRTLYQTAQNMRPIFTSNPQNGQQRLVRLLRRSTDPVFRRMVQETNRKNAALDTRENYLAEARQCSNW